MGQAPSSIIGNRPVSVYIGTDREALSLMISKKLIPSPRTVVVTSLSWEWSSRLGALGPDRPEWSKPQYLHDPSQIRLTDPGNFLKNLLKDKRPYQILLDHTPPQLFYESMVDATIAGLFTLSQMIDGPMILSVMVPDQSFATVVEKNLRSRGFLIQDSVSCWLVASGNIPIRYLRLGFIDPIHHDMGLPSPHCQPIAQVITSLEICNPKPLIEVTKL